MEKDQADEAASQLINSFQAANQAAVESMIAAQKRNTKFAQSFISDWIEAFKSYTENTSTLMQENEQRTQQQLEALQKVAEGSADIYFDFLRASLSLEPKSLNLHENFRICLLALASRYPHHIVDINEEVLGPQSLGAEGWTASDIIELFESTAPQLLQERACLEINAQNRGIFLIERSEQIPALWVHCGCMGEKVPPYRGNMANRRENQSTVTQV